MTKKAMIKMPIGIDDFKKLVENDCFFADKSLLIADLLENGSEATLLTRPRRFGKTLNLSMLRYFFDTQQAEENKKLFKNLAIKNNPKAMAQMGQYPVVMLSLKSIKSLTLEKQLNGFKTLMSRLYGQHTYLLDHLDPIDAKFFNRVRQEQINQSQLASSLKDLITFINHYHNKKVIVLIDEYDHPLLNAFRGGFDEDFSLFYRSFMGNALKSNTAVHFAVVTGIMQIAGSGMFSDFNNVNTFSILDEQYATAFGLSEQNVRSLLTLCGKEEKLDEVQRWYNGYSFGRQKHTMYNPWSVLQYVSRDCVPSAYWVHTSDNQLLRQELLGANDNIRTKFVSLMAKNGKVSVVFDGNLRFAEVGAGQDQVLWVLLLSSGYLKANVQLEVAGGLIHADLSIPNEEVRFIYHRLFHSWLVEKVESTKTPSSLLTQLAEGQIEGFCHNLEIFFMATISAHDVGTDNSEAFYHGFLLGLLGLMNHTHKGHLRSNSESGLGRFDITFEPHDPNTSPAIVFELKRLGKGEIQTKSKEQIKQCLQSYAQEGFEQIKTKAYDTDLIARGARSIAYVSLAFSGKQMAFQCEGPNTVESNQ